MSIALIERTDTPPETVVQDWLLDLLAHAGRPSARELVSALEHDVGLRARWHLADAVNVLAQDAKRVTRADREFLSALLQDGSLAAALRGEGAEDPFVASTIDALLRRSGALRDTAAFREMIAFMARFKRYSPYNNLLVRVQNPSCKF